MRGTYSIRELFRGRAGSGKGWYIVATIPDHVFKEVCANSLGPMLKTWDVLEAVLDDAVLLVLCCTCTHVKLILPAKYFAVRPMETWVLGGLHLMHRDSLRIV